MSSGTDTPALPFKPAYRRVLLKLSGESFSRAGEQGISMAAVSSISDQVQRVVAAGVQLAIVVGGGNILRGREFSAVSSSINPATAHYMGMLATVINGLGLQDALEAVGIPTRLQTAIRMEGVAEPFIRRRCIRHLEKGRVVILAGGTGSPFVTTDTAAALRAREIDADVLLKATQVDGIYAEDPKKNPHAVRYSDVSYQEVLQKNLQFIDAQAIHHCKEHNLPIIVFNYHRSGNIERAIAGERIGSRMLPRRASWPCEVRTMNQDDILLDTEERMEKAVEVFQGQLHGIRTGRATPGLVDSIRVDYYGSQTPIKQMASITVQEGKQIVVRPYDASAISNIVKAIQSSEVGLTPNSDGRLIRINVPPLSTERRRQLRARVKKLAEEARVAIRNVRRDGNKHADQLQKDKGCTEDERDQLKEQVQEFTKTYEAKVNSLAEGKEQEIMED